MIAIKPLHTAMGHNPNVFFEDTDPEKRAELAKLIKEHIKLGNAVFLTRKEGGEYVATDRVVDYDSESNEWILKTERGVKVPRRVSAKDTEVHSVGRARGG